MEDPKNKGKNSNFWSTERVDKLMYDAEEYGIDYKDVDNPFYENDPEIKSGNILWEFTEGELDEIKRCATDVIYFANKYCQVMTDDGIQQITLRDYQEQILMQYQEHRKNIFVSPRQSGKCFLPTTNVTLGNNKKTSVNKLYKQNTFLSIIKSILFKAYILAS